MNEQSVALGATTFIVGRYGKRIPDLSPDDRAALRASMVERGVVVPIVIDENNAVIDGQHRLLFAAELGLEPRFDIRPGLTEEQKEALAQSLNADRRQLTVEQKRELVADGRRAGKSTREIAEETGIPQQTVAKYSTDHAGSVERVTGRDGKLRPATKAPANARQERQAKARELAAKKLPQKAIAAELGVSVGTVNADLKAMPSVMVSHSELKAVSKRLDKLSSLASISPTAAAADTKTALNKDKERRRQVRRDANAAKVELAKDVRAGIGDARFATIVADPPWSPESVGVVDVVGRSNPQYATMSDEDIENLTPWGRPVDDLADTDAHLYLWVVNRNIPTGIRILEAWGFRFVTMLTWCKPSIGIGNYFRNNTEHVLFGVKGSQRLKRADLGTWFKAKRGPAGHSSKPPEFYDLVDSCSPGPVLELFSRIKREGWTAWGESS